MMLHQKQSSSSPSLGVVYWDLPSSDASWLKTSGSSSCASSIAERSVREYGRHKEASIWRSLFVGRSHSVPNPSSHSHDLPRTGSGDDQEQETRSQDARSMFGAESSREPEHKRTTKIYMQHGWRYTQQGRKLNGSLPNLSREDTQKTDHLPSSRSGSISGRSSKPASQSLSWPFRSSQKLGTRRQSKRPSVSGPYNFRHLAHTSPSILSGSAKIHSDGSAENASGSQISTDRLQVTQVNELHSFRLSSSIEAIIKEETTSTSPPLSPGSLPKRSNVDDSNGSSVTLAESHALRYSVWSDEEETTSTRSSRLLIPPPRTSSRNALTFVNNPVPIVASTTSSPALCNTDVVELDNEHARVHTADVLTGTVSTGGPDQRNWQCEDLQMPHAVTTPDDSAWPLKPARDSGSRTELADVPEEEEGYCSLRPDTISSKGHSFTQIWRQASSSFDSQTTSAAPTCRTSLTSFESIIQPEGSIRSQSRFSEPFDVQSYMRSMNAPASSHRAAKGVSIEVCDDDGCWEDDIDYCYEHAVEADCTYEWGLNSDNQHKKKDLEEGKVTSADIKCVHGSVASSQVGFSCDDHRIRDQAGPFDMEGAWKKEEALASNASRPSLVVCTVADIPDLDPTSTLSSARDSELVTPSPLEARTSSSTKSGSGLFRNPFKESGLFVMNDALLLLKDNDGQIEEEPMEVESPASDGPTKRPISRSITGLSNEMDQVNIASSKEVDPNTKDEADGIAQERMPRKMPSHDDVLYTSPSKSRKERSPSESGPKISSPTKRKVITRNKSMSYLGTSRVSYALFPSS